MATVFITRQLSEDVQNGKDALVQIESACQTAQAKIQRLNQIRTDWVAYVAAGDLDQASVDELDNRTTGMAGLFTAINTYLATL